MANASKRIAEATVIGRAKAFNKNPNPNPLEGGVLLRNLTQLHLTLRNQALRAKPGAEKERAEEKAAEVLKLHKEVTATLSNLHLKAAEKAKSRPTQTRQQLIQVAASSPKPSLEKATIPADSNRDLRTELQRLKELQQELKGAKEQADRARSFRATMQSSNKTILPKTEEALKKFEENHSELSQKILQQSELVNKLAKEALEAKNQPKPSLFEKIAVAIFGKKSATNNTVSSFFDRVIASVKLAFSDSKSSNESNQLAVTSDAAVDDAINKFMKKADEAGEKNTAILNVLGTDLTAKDVNYARELDALAVNIPENKVATSKNETIPVDVVTSSKAQNSEPSKRVTVMQMFKAQVEEAKANKAKEITLSQTKPAANYGGNNFLDKAASASGVDKAPSEPAAANTSVSPKVK